MTLTWTLDFFDILFFNGFAYFQPIKCASNIPSAICVNPHRSKRSISVWLGEVLSWILCNICHVLSPFSSFSPCPTFYQQVPVLATILLITVRDKITPEIQQKSHLVAFDISTPWWMPVCIRPHRTSNSWSIKSTALILPSWGRIYATKLSLITNHL